jgi:hypothetical protein
VTKAAALLRTAQVVSLPDPEEQVTTDLLRKARFSVRPARKAGWTHVSDLVSKCARKKAFIECGLVPPASSSLSLSESLTYAQGDAIHDVIKQRLARAGPALVYGKWRCSCGSLRVEEPCELSRVDSSVTCEVCEGPADTYEEIDVRDEKLKIVGHPDVVLWLPELFSYYVVEIKSISPDQYKELVRPKPEHVLQVLFYWYLMALNGFSMVDQVSILYVTKGFTFRGDPYKEFKVCVRTELSKLDDFLQEAKQIADAKAGGAFPPRLICASRLSPDAKVCEAASLCFSSTDPRQAKDNADQGKKVSPPSYRSRPRPTPRA